MRDQGGGTIDWDDFRTSWRHLIPNCPAAERGHDDQGVPAVDARLQQGPRPDPRRRRFYETVENERALFSGT